MEKLHLCLDDYSEFLCTKSGQDFLSELAKSDDLYLLARVAECEQTSSKTLTNLMKRLLATKDEQKLIDIYGVLICIVNNTSLDEEGVELVCEYALTAKEEYCYMTQPYNMLVKVLEGVASHPNTGDKTFLRLWPESETVIKKMVNNPSFSDELLIRAVEATRNTNVLCLAAYELARRLKAKNISNEEK